MPFRQPARLDFEKEGNRTSGLAWIRVRRYFRLKILAATNANHF
jgi:hypothetical protein